MTVTQLAPRSGVVALEEPVEKLDGLARHLAFSPQVVGSVWPRVRRRLARWGIRLDWWERAAAELALGLDRRGRYAHTVGGVVWSIPRQVGKTFTVMCVLLALCVEFPGLRVVWTAHHSRTLQDAFDVIRGLVRDPRVAGHLLVTPRSDGVRASNGQQEIRFKNGSVFMMGAREQGFGRGIHDVDVLGFDEAQILGLKAQEDMVAATNQARHEHGALIFYLGTPPRPTDPGEAFTEKRRQAVERVAENLLYLEFSADPESDPDDRSQFAVMNPSWPRRTPTESLERLRANLGSVDSWNREGRGIWDAVDRVRYVIDPDSLAAVADPGSMAMDRLTLAIDVAPDRSVAAVGLAGRRPDGLWHVELDEHRRGADWTVGWVAQRAGKNRLHAVVVDELAGLTEVRHKRNYLRGTSIEVTLLGARQQAIAAAGLFDSVMGATVRHTDQPQVLAAFGQAGKRAVGAGWAWDKKSATSDITPVVAITDALWGAQSEDVKRPVRGWSADQQQGWGGGGGWVAS